MLADVVAVALLAAPVLLPAAAAGGTYWLARDWLRANVSARLRPVVRGCWLGGAALLVVAPALTVYTLRTTLGVTSVSLPAPGLVGFRVASWAVVAGVGAVGLAAAVAAVDGWRGPS